jgi:hypothetical protein
MLGSTPRITRDAELHVSRTFASSIMAFRLADLRRYRFAARG